MDFVQNRETTKYRERGSTCFRKDYYNTDTMRTGEIEGSLRVGGRLKIIVSGVRTAAG